MSEFVHLHLHSQYSLLESSIQIPDLLKKCQESGMDSVAITDDGNLFSAVEFYLQAKKAGIKAIIGCDVYIAPGARSERKTGHTRLVLLAQDLGGYRELCRLVSLGYTEGFYYKPRVDWESLQKHSQGLIALTGGLRGHVAQTFSNRGEEAALEEINRLKDLYGDRLYLEIQRHGLKTEDVYNRFLQKASKTAAVKLVATNDPHYLERTQSFAQEILMCIGAGQTMVDPEHPKLPNEQFYFKTAAEMKAIFEDLPEAIENSLEVASRCDLRFKLTDEKGNTIYHLPTFPAQEGRSLKEEIKFLAEKGLEQRFEEARARGEPVAAERKPEYAKRLEYELSVIDRMGFSGYFLIVQDFINYAKSKDIPVGPGRGSGAGSLVAYSLRITDLDPIRYHLLFERFLNPERVSMPDFDVDFCQDRRGEVIHYVTEKYGKESVAQIITFGKLQARAALRDVGRAMGMSFGEVDVIAKLVPEKLGISLDEAIEMEPRFKELMENDPKIASLLDTAKALEGLTRHASIHAAGVIISDRPLVEHCPLYKGSEGETVVQFDMVHAEKIGLIKFDFLGLKTLTVIHNALSMIKRNRQTPEAKRLSTQSIPLSDPKIYELLSKGDTLGVFQFEGEGISEFIQKFKPTCFEDITAINALYRPGPMNMLDEYVMRKQGKIPVSYVFPRLEEVLKETYGIIVYQEQVQLIAARCANYSLGEADLLRRAMGKKKPEEMAKQRERFLKGCAENALDPKKSGELFDLMAKFAEYGFNKSHAAAYCVVAAQTAYLKSYYPVEFYAALITTEMSDTDKVVKYIRDAATAHGIKVRSPNVNSSDYGFSAVGDEVVYGLGAIKGVGQSAVEAIVEARQAHGAFKTVTEFFENVDLRRVNKKVVECLIKGGAFDELHPNRAALFAGFEKILEGSEQKRKDRELGQTSLFDLTEEAHTIELPAIEEWPRSRRLAYEKEVLGFYLSDHPLQGLEPILKNHVTSVIAGLANIPSKKKVVLGGVMAELKEFITKKGTRMAFGTLEDQTGSVELVIFSDTYLKYQSLFKSDRPIFIKGNLENEEEGRLKILVEEATNLHDLAIKARELVIEINGGVVPSDQSQVFIQKLSGIFRSHPGETPSRLLVGFDTKCVSLELGPEFNVNPTEEFFEDLERHLGNQGLARLN